MENTSSVGAPGWGGGAEKGLTMNTGMQGTEFAAAFGERLLFMALTGNY